MHTVLGVVLSVLHLCPSVPFFVFMEFLKTPRFLLSAPTDLLQRQGAVLEFGAYVQFEVYSIV